MESKYVKKYLCSCKKEMRLDDIDYNFKGNQDEYYICDECGRSAVIKIRYGKVVGIEVYEND